MSEAKDYARVVHGIILAAEEADGAAAIAASTAEAIRQDASVLPFGAEPSSYVVTVGVVAGRGDGLAGR